MESLEKDKIKISSLASAKEIENRTALLKLQKQNPLPEQEIISNTALFLKRQELSKILFFNEIYKKVSLVHGIIIEFGCRWGQNLVTFNNLRGIYEPFNYNRRIVGFDTFSGFNKVHEKDGNDAIVAEGNFNVTKDYEHYLKELLETHEAESPLEHISKNILVKGNAEEELVKYLEANPQTIIAFAWFDFDLYKPTLECLKLIKPHLTKGSILGFDELNDPKFPGETQALSEVFNLNDIKINRNKFSGMQSYIEFN